jgi:hypothetical protein
MTATDILELPFLHINYQKDLQVLFCRWRNPVDIRQFSEGYKAALQFAVRQHTKFWLHDLRLRNNSSEEECSWFSRTFVPALKSALGSGNFIAYLMSPLQREALVPEGRPIYEPVTFTDALVANFFTNEHDAMAWLNTCRIRELIS